MENLKYKSEVMVLVGNVTVLSNKLYNPEDYYKQCVTINEHACWN